MINVAEDEKIEVYSTALSDDESISRPKVLQITKNDIRVAQVRLYPLADTNDVLLDEVFTHPDCRNQGLAREVCEKAIAYATSRSIKLITHASPFSKTNISEEALIRFAHSLGFQQIGTTNPAFLTYVNEDADDGVSQTQAGTHLDGV